MGKIQDLSRWWLVPPDPFQADAEARKSNLFKGIKTYLFIAGVMLVFSWHDLLIYAVWLLVVFIHGAYHYNYALAGSMDRPFLYDRTAALLLLLDFVTHIALAGFSSIGWFALVPLALAWFYFGRAVGALAAAKAMKSITSLVGSEHASETTEEQRQIAGRIFRERLELLAD